ncbi:MAG: 5-formyltetrahydrofolate cyclo-ligase [Solidesulfovibrio sp.]
METLQPNQTIDNDKSALRRDMLRRRDALSRDFVMAASQAVIRGVMQLPRWPLAGEVLAYLPIRNEVDATALVEDLLARGRRLLLPRCRDNQPGQLDLGCVSCLTDVTPGRYGILEPRQDLCLPPEAFAPDMILVPGLAFDATGARLGFGGGYYDRLLALPLATGAYIVGLGYDFQMTPRLPVAIWDKPMDAIVTELQTYRVTL